MLNNEITELIKKKAEEKYPGKNESTDGIDSAWVQEQLRAAYTSGQIDAIEMMIGFILWADDNYFREGRKDSWTDMIGEEEAQHFTTIELLIKYLNIKENG